MKISGVNRELGVREEEGGCGRGPGRGTQGGLENRRRQQKWSGSTDPLLAKMVTLHEL